MARPKNESVSLAPAEDADRERWEATKLLLRLLRNRHDLDLRMHMAAHLDPARLDAWGPPTKALNLFRSLILQLAVLYNEAPVLSHPDLSPEQVKYAASLNPFRFGKRHQQYVLATRQSLIRVGWSAGVEGVAEPGPTIRLVTNDRVVAIASEADPSALLRVEEPMWRRDPIAKRWGWFWDVWSVEDPTNPYFRVLDGQRKDVTEKMLGGERPYAFVDPDTGAPFLPWVLCHAEPTGEVWDNETTSELVDGTLDAALLASFFLHITKNAAWRQKYGLDVELNGQSASGQGAAGAKSVPTDPASILLFRSRGERAQVSSIEQPADPLATISAIRAYVSMVTESMGMTASDIELVQKEESGVAIQVRRDAIRRLQAQYEPQARASDLELAAKIAKISNIFSGEDKPYLPTTGWSISYPGLPFSREEETDRLAAMEKRIAMGVASRVDAILLGHPDWSREQCIAHLQMVSEEQLATEPQAAKDNPYASVGLPALLLAGVITTAEARTFLGLPAEGAPKLPPADPATP